MLFDAREKVLERSYDTEDDGLFFEVVLSFCFVGGIRASRAMHTMIVGDLEHMLQGWNCW